MTFVARLLAGLILATAGLVAHAEAQVPQSCMFTHFRTKSAACADEVVSLAASMPPKAFNSWAPPIGFLAATFLQSPSEKARILAGAQEKGANGAVLIALMRAGLVEDAERFAAERQLDSLLARVRSARLPTLVEITKSASAKENDFLSGAYGASGDRRYLDALLGSFTDVDDATTRTALRMGLVARKWGMTFAPTGHRTQIMKNLCARYDCSDASPDGAKVLAMLAAYWSVASIAEEDAATRKAFEKFFEKKTTLKAVLQREQAYLANYVSALMVAQMMKVTESKDDTRGAYEAATRAIETFESFGALPQALPATAKATVGP